MDGHVAGGEGAGFVEGDGVDAGESFDGVEILDEDFFTAEADGGESEDARSEEDETLWDHVDESSDGAGDGDGGVGFGAESGPEEEGADGDEGEADVFDDVVHEFEEFTIGGLDGVGVLLELSELGLSADGSDSSFTGARDHEGAGDEFVALILCDAALLAGDIGFVDFYSSLFDFGVDDDLVTEAEDDKIAFDEIFGGDLEGFAVPDDGGVLLGDEFEFVDGAFGADFVDDAD